MRLRQIEVFHAVYANGSISAAARALNVSQPAVSKVLRASGYRRIACSKNSTPPIPGIRWSTTNSATVSARSVRFVITPNVANTVITVGSFFAGEATEREFFGTVHGAYLSGVRAHTGCSGPFLGYGVGTDNLADPPIEWRGTDTVVQATGIDQEFGVYDDPDSFYRAHGVNARGLKRWLYSQIMRKAMNRRVARIRAEADRALSQRY